MTPKRRASFVCCFQISLLSGVTPKKLVSMEYVKYFLARVLTEVTPKIFASITAN